MEILKQKQMSNESAREGPGKGEGNRLTRENYKWKMNVDNEFLENIVLLLPCKQEKRLKKHLMFLFDPTRAPIN